MKSRKNTHTHLVTSPTVISPQVSLSLQEPNSILNTLTFCKWPYFSFHWLGICILRFLYIASSPSFSLPFSFFLYLTLYLPQIFSLTDRKHLWMILATTVLAPNPQAILLSSFPQIICKYCLFCHILSPSFIPCVLAF